ncbi:MAG: polyprenol monophosphomannose synthase [Micrococcaceae bacterium]
MKILVVIPTYNERENLPLIISRLRASVDDAHVLVVDDNSPDGTGEVADKLAAEDECVHVLHRKEKNGLGGAYVAGFTWGIERGYDVLVEMDADGSHQPEQLPLLLAETEKGADLVIGSRYVKGGKVVNWPPHRLALSYGGNLYIRALMGTGIHDITAGYRVYTKDCLEKIDYKTIQSQGYSFQTELARRCFKAGCTIVEVPITFVEREIGESKMDTSIVKESLQRMTRWGIEDRTEQFKQLVRSKKKSSKG